MAKITKYHFVLKSEQDKSKSALIYVMFSLDKRYKLSIGETVLPQWWDKENERAIESSLQTQQEQRRHKRLNKYIEYLNEQLQGLFETYKDWRRVRPSFIGLPLPVQIANMVKDIITKYHKKEIAEVKKKEMKPSEFFQQYADNIRNKVVKRTGTFRCRGTQVNHLTILKRYKDFLFTYKLVDEFYIFNESFEEKFETWCLKERGYSPNTIAASFSIFKIWLNEAEKQGLITDKAFHSYKTKAVAPIRQYLNEDEIQRIYDIAFTDELKREHNIDFKSHIEETRDLFVVACNLGLRLSDWKILSDSEWDWENNVVSINTTKTKERVVIPISTQVQEIYNKYNGQFPKPTDKTTLNRQIQRFCKVAQINDDVYVLENVHGEIERRHYKKYELITSHTGRRSFATNLYLKCKNAKMVMQFTGHKTEENFFKYICVDKMENAKLAQEYFK